MSAPLSPESWLTQNDAYLGASLRWLRLLLEKLVPAEPMPPVAPPVVASAKTFSDEADDKSWRWWSARNPGGTPTSSIAATPTPLLVEATQPSIEQALEEAEKKRTEAASIDPPPALELLAQRFGLSNFERDIVLLCVAPEFDPTFAGLFTRVHGAGRPWPTYGMALSLFQDPSWEALSPHRALRQSRLIEINQPPGTPLTSSALRPDERTVNFVKGLNSMDDRLTGVVAVLENADDTVRAPSQKAVLDALLDGLRQAFDSRTIPVVQLVGVDEGSRRAIAIDACKVLSRRLYRVNPDALPGNAAEIEALARLWQRETLLLPVALYAEAEAVDSLSPETSTAIRRLLSREIGLVFVGVRDTPLALGVPGFHMETPRPTPGEQRDEWINVLVGGSEEEKTSAAQMLAGQFQLNFAQIREVANRALQNDQGTTTLTDRLWDAARDLTRPRLDSLAQRLESKADWNQLVLPAEQMDLMRQITAQVRHRQQVYNDWGFSNRMNRGYGIAALFAGESGTGKTMAAEVIAKDLRLNLYRIDLSSVVSKYIGETEKNLRKLFDAAEQGGAILFFDEADALFGKRSEVKDSHDRYANIEINYLLQRLETFSGLAILATNMKSSLDSAFLRRLRFIVNFPFPSVKERKQIWERVLPEQTPRESIDFDKLARLGVSGGNIHSIALNAAFRAAQSGGTVTMPDLLAAARSELRKLDKAYNEAEFR